MSDTSVADRTTVVDVLRRIEARLADPSRWCQRANARGKTGRPVQTFSKRAVAHCLDGARLVESKRGDYTTLARVDRLLIQAARQCYPRSGATVDVNDDLGHDAVMAVIRRAIELAEQDGTP